MMEIPIHGGTTENELDYSIMVSAILSIPILIYSMASLMVYGMVFVGDTWNGHVLFGFLLSGDGEQNRRVTAEWLIFVLYIAIPVIASSICFYVKVDRAGEISLLIWYVCMNITFFIFCALGFYHETKLCLDLTRIIEGDNNRGMVGILKNAILTTLKQRFAGFREESYVIEKGEFDPRKSTKPPTSTHMGLYSRSTAWSWNPFFDVMDPPQRRYSMEEIRDISPYVTNKTWSLEKMCCHLRNGRSRLVLSGPNALEPYQYKSTLGCTVVGIVLGVMFLVGFLIHMGQSLVIIIVVGVVVAICVGVPCLLSATQLYKAMPEEVADNNRMDDEDEAPHLQGWVSYTVSKPKEWYCWFRLILDVLVLFLWPMAMKYANNLPKNGTLFLVIGLFSLVRLNLDAASVIREYGSLSNLELSKEKNKTDSEEERKAKVMIAKARASEVMGKITTSSRLVIWVCVYFGLAAYFFYSVATYDNGQGPQPNTGRDPIKVLRDFYYPGVNDTMSYPTCKLEKGFAMPGQTETYMTDYNLMAALAYETENITGYVLDQWYGEEKFAVEEKDFMLKWREMSDNLDALVSFKLYSIPSQPGFGVIAIRGTEIHRDRLLNMQLYMGTTIVQFMEMLIPFSWIFSSIFPDLIKITGFVGSEQLQDSNYYSTIVEFIDDLTNGFEYQDKTFNTLRVTGVSLGGGLAMIAGAQSGAYAVGFAGPNPVLPRKTFIPEVELKDINERVINVVPDADFASRVGGIVRNIQRIDCHTDWDRVYQKCHAFWMQLCEFLYSCGSGNRPVLCICVELYGFPEPEPTGNRTNFAEACTEEEANIRPYMGTSENTKMK